MGEHPVGTVEAACSAEDIRSHHEHDHVAAIFTDRDDAERAVDALRSLGFGSDHLGIAMHGGEQVVFEHDGEAELTRDAVIGAATGAGFGALAGIALAALALPGIGVIGLGGTLAIAGASSFWGLVLGGYAGTAAGEKGWERHEDISYTALHEGEVLVVVCSHGQTEVVEEVLRRHHGRRHPVEPRSTGEDMATR